MKIFFFGHNFFQWPPRALKPLLNAFLGPFYPKNVVLSYIQALEKVLKRKIFRPQKSA